MNTLTGVLIGDGGAGRCRRDGLVRTPPCVFNMIFKGMTEVTSDTVSMPKMLNDGVRSETCLMNVFVLDSFSRAHG